MRKTVKAILKRWTYRYLPQPITIDGRNFYPFLQSFYIILFSVHSPSRTLPCRTFPSSIVCKNTGMWRGVQSQND